MSFGEHRPWTTSVREGDLRCLRLGSGGSMLSSVSSVDEVLTLLRSKRAPQHRLASLSAGEERGRRSA